MRKGSGKSKPQEVIFAHDRRLSAAVLVKAWRGTRIVMVENARQPRGSSRLTKGGC